MGPCLDRKPAKMLAISSADFSRGVVRMVRFFENFKPNWLRLQFAIGCEQDLQTRSKLLSVTGLT